MLMVVRTLMVVRMSMVVRTLMVVRMLMGVRMLMVVRVSGPGSQGYSCRGTQSCMDRYAIETRLMKILLEYTMGLQQTEVNQMI